MLTPPNLLLLAERVSRFGSALPFPVFCQ